ncbi:AraC family transcriptional regulator [Paracoccus sp. (in: a-proteobacteria)]|uniref:helix-turn-helix domain-containing protein n=2 Tax=Paracoccus sp. TaxID=267 RepID=UPI002B002435|nr:AraC family transcriptional regulator [Paracoccus sp. (in: a-proteobacteria)]
MNEVCWAFTSLNSVTPRFPTAGVTTGTILEPAAADPRLPAPPPPPEPAPRRPQVLAPIVIVPPDKPAHDPMALQIPGQRLAEGVRLIPLAGFRWGSPAQGQTTPPIPRVRGDHVLLRPTGGMVTIVFRRHSHTLLAGHVAFIPAGTAFSLKPSPDVRGMALLVSPGLCAEQPPPPGFSHGIPGTQDARLLDPIMYALSLPDADNTTITGLLGEIVAMLSRLDDRAARPGPPAGGLTEARTLTERFVQLARSELHSNQTIAEMARRLGYSLAQLDHACRRSRGRSALELLYELRLERATSALRDGNQPVAEIAEMLGYTGLGHFIRAFLAATGRSPEAYRALTRQGGSKPQPGIC